ncbi:Unknown protein sequence [Pseudomonas syringae pv. maculicola]|nr:Unknown protein sequence [Pseudomonas syringae pv. maculicola]
MPEHKISDSLQLPSVQNPRLGDTALRVIATFAEDLKRGIPDGYH